METIETLAMWVAVGASSFALALAMQWAMLRALFCLMPRRMAKEASEKASSIHTQLYPAGSRAA